MEIINKTHSEFNSFVNGYLAEYGQRPRIFARVDTIDAAGERETLIFAFRFFVRRHFISRVCRQMGRDII